ncbi:hypothetical protein [Pedobacter boryungensis]|nr:hypothetical protein [Pedobacter boryungensis]
MFNIYSKKSYGFFLQKSPLLIQKKTAMEANTLAKNALSQSSLI